MSDAIIDQPWTRRWWRVPGESLLSQTFDNEQVAVSFTWCNPTEWGFDFVVHGAAPVSAFFDLDAEGINGAEGVPKKALVSLLEQLKARETGIRNATKLAQDPLLMALASRLGTVEWCTGRKLRKQTGLEIDAFQKQLRRLMPRFIRRDAFEEDDKYSLTLPGLIVMDAELNSIALMESVYQAIARCYERNEDAEVFENDDLVACGTAPEKVGLAHTIARICLLVGAGATLNERVLRIPADREMIAAQVKKKVRFLDYLHHAATEAQRNEHFAVKRPWLNAPLWIERDGSATSYLPLGFSAPAIPSSIASEDAATGTVPVTPPTPPAGYRLPRLEVAYGKKLGEGALGTVWEATDKLLERKLAVKFLTSTDESHDEDALLRQAKSLAMVHHASLVVVYGAAWLPHPTTGLVQPAIMMELLAGEPLLKWRDVQRDRESALRVAADVFAAIDAMHAAGLHHGDLHAKNVIVLPDGHAKVIDWRYQDTFLAKSTASRDEVVASDARHAIDIIVAMFEKQGLADESLELRRASGIRDARTLIDKFQVPPSTAQTVAVPAPPTPSFPPSPGRLDRAEANKNETSEYQAELAIWPTPNSDMDASELMAEFDSLVRAGVTSPVIEMMFQRAARVADGSRRWLVINRPYGNVLQKWELELRDGAFLAFRWAYFSTHNPILFETRELLDAVVLPIHMYERATAAAAKSAGASAIRNAHLRLVVETTRPLALHDDNRITTPTTRSPKSEAGWQAHLNSQLPGAPGAIASRLINRALSNFQLERDHFVGRDAAAPIVRLESAEYDKYLQVTRVKPSKPVS